MKAKLVIRHILWGFFTVYFASTIQQTIAAKDWSYWAITALGTIGFAYISYTNRDKTTDPQ